MYVVTSILAIFFLLSLHLVYKSHMFLAGNMLPGFYGETSNLCNSC